MYLENIDRRRKDLDRLTIHPTVRYKSRPSNLRLVLTEVNYFLNDPQTDELIWELFKKFILKK